jgi:hypothetical protein
MASVFSALWEKSSEILILCEVFVKDRLLNIASLGNSRDSFQGECALLDNIRHDISALQLSLTVAAKVHGHQGQAAVHASRGPDCGAS